jgi:hypothetical protein
VVWDWPPAVLWQQQVARVQAACCSALPGPGLIAASRQSCWCAVCWQELKIWLFVLLLLLLLLLLLQVC